MHRRTAWWIFTLLVAATVFFRLAPSVDIAVSRLFYDGNAFFSASAFWRTVRPLPIAVTQGLVAVLAILWGIWLWRYARRRKKPDFLSFAKLAFPSVAILLGPGLSTNLVLKEHWGRPRPDDLKIFGGDATFVLPWDISDQCLNNCSFVAGEVSTALWLATFIPLLPAAWHERTFWLVALYTLFIGWLRIALGAHFLSDVVFSILLNGLVFWFVWGWFFERETVETALPSASEI